MIYDTEYNIPRRMIVTRQARSCKAWRELFRKLQVPE